ncbi:AAA family ATPase [Exiguobacterium sp. s149]|uniref:AAA family ATPase n=1 Tax=Exiguobacterium TaxID=33986 RepID=UPI001BE77D8C|nr:AAA family ATPase [Exiguobacterium sp. s149]
MGNQISAYEWMSKSINQNLSQYEDNDIEDAMIRLLRIKVKKNLHTLDERMDRDYSRLIEKAGDLEIVRTPLTYLNSFYLCLDGDVAMKYVQATLAEKGIRVGDDVELNTVSDLKDLYDTLQRTYKITELASQLNVDVQKTLEWLHLTIREFEKIEHFDQQKKDTKESILKELEQMIGLDSIKQEIYDLLDWIEFSKLRKQAGFKTQPLTLHTVYSGNPGTGKTTIARLVGRLLKAMGLLSSGHMVEVSRQDLVAEYVGQTAVKTQKQINLAQGGVLFIDEAYSLARGGDTDFGKEAIDTLVKGMEDKRDQFVIILAGYRHEMKELIKINPGLESRFTRYFDFPDYDVDELMQIAELQLRQSQYVLEDRAKNKMLLFLERGHQGNGRLVRNFVEALIMRKAVHSVTHASTDLQLITEDMLSQVIRDWKR